MEGLGELHLHIGACGSPDSWPGPRQFASLHEFVCTYDRLLLDGLDQSRQLAIRVQAVRQLRARMRQDGCVAALVTANAAPHTLDQLLQLAQQVGAGNTPTSHIALLASWTRGCPPSHVELALQWAYECPLVVAVGIAGSEQIPLRPIDRRGIQQAHQMGLLVALHAGEISDARDVWAAIDAGADRIAHGIRAVQDRRLLRYMADNHIACDLSIYSNRAIGDAVGTNPHPLGQMLQAGVPCTLSTDDPAIFGQTLQDEFAAAADLLGSGQDLEYLRQQNQAAAKMVQDLLRRRSLQRVA
jgi:adenosine deaminase